MEFCEASVNDIAEINTIYEAYIHSFPEDERRDKAQFEALFRNKNVKIFSIVLEHKFVAYLITWHLDNVVFIEHFEVFEAYRNLKLGSVILKAFTKKFPKLILESEPETLGAIAIRRLAFYKRNGFDIVERNHIQPAYSKEKQALKLYLLSNFEIEDIVIIIQEINEVVYGKN